MKKVFVSLVSILLVFMLAFSANISVFAEDVTGGAEETSTDENHVHSRELVSLPTVRIGSYHEAGYFYCSECGEYYYDELTYDDLGMPIISLTGSFYGMTKNTKVTVNFNYSDDDQNFQCDCTMKWQGSTSLQYDKKNYTITLLNSDGKKNKVCFNDEWGKQSKYVLKANYVDFSQSRNIVSAEIFGEIVKSRNKCDEFESLVNGGAIDGFPVVVYHDGYFWGLYTLNIPKDDWLFDMGDEDSLQAIFFGDQWTDSVALYEEIAENPEDSGWDIEYCSTEDNEEIGTAWIRESFNKFIDFLNTCTEEEFNEHINDYTDIDRAIDLFIYTIFIHANDNTAKNIIWATYDGVKWIPSAYDMDGTWGCRYDGQFYYSSSDFPFGNYNKLFELILKYKKSELVSRYVELREDILSIENIKNHFSSFFALIPDIVYEVESTKWPDEPNMDMNNYDQIINFTSKRINYLDNLLGVRIVEKTSLSNKVSFERDAEVNVSVYPGIDLSKIPETSNSGWSVNSKSGVYTKKNGIVYFEVTASEGYSVGEVTCSDENCTVLTPEETGKENVYAVKGINNNLSVTVKADDLPVKAYTVNFDIPDGVEVNIYSGQNNAAVSESTLTAYSLDAQTGKPVKDGSGQVNFSLSFADGVELDSIVVSPIEGYQNLISTEETANPDTYRITKISQNLTVKVYTNNDPAPDEAGYIVTFITADNVDVMVYPGQDYDVTPVKAYKTYSVDLTSGEPTLDNGQVNFRIDIPEYTEITDITISPFGGFAEVVSSEDGVDNNIICLTGITSDITVTITTVYHNYTDRFEQSATNSGFHIAYCECGSFIELPHTFGSPVTVDGKPVFICKDCGFTKDFILGDASDDGSLDVSDARLALRIAISLDKVEENSYEFLLSDVDGDGKITVMDARYILRAAIGLEEDLFKYHPEIPAPENESTTEASTAEEITSDIQNEEESMTSEEQTTEESITIEETTLPEETSVVIDSTTEEFSSQT